MPDTPDLLAAVERFVSSAERFEFDSDGIEHPVYKDGSGPGVLILHELPGMTPECIRLADLVLREGYTVYLPLFFGKPGDHSTLLGNARLVPLCIRREFNCLATDKPSRISGWLRALSRRMHEECGGVGVGAIGMCLTGNVILSVMIEDAVVVPVLSQPGVPFLPLTAARKQALGIPPQDLSLAVEKAARAPILGYRFTTDWICPAERFDTLRQAFGGNFKGTEIPTGQGHPGNIPGDAHSVLTKDFVDVPDHPTRKALDEILHQFRRRLQLRV